MIPWSFYRLGRQTLGKSWIAGYYLIVVCEKYLRRVILGALAVLLLALFAPHSALAEPAADDTEANTTQWTYDEIVNDPEFYDYMPIIQLAILMQYFFQSEKFPSIGYYYFGSVGGTEYSTKYYTVTRTVTVTDYFVCMALLNSVLSPHFLKAYRENNEFRTFLTQYCRYYSPLVSYLFIRGNCDDVYYDYIKDAFLMVRQRQPMYSFYIEGLSEYTVLYFASLAPPSSGESLRRGESIEPHDFRYCPN